MTKKEWIFAVLLLLTVNCASQTACTPHTETLPSDTTVYNVVECMPEFPGGTGAMMKFISENLKYPEMTIEEGMYGRFVFRFIVEKDGSLSHFEMIRSINQAIDEECRRLVDAMPAWKPGLRKGKAVRVYYTLPINIDVR